MVPIERAYICIAEESIQMEEENDGGGVGFSELLRVEVVEGERRPGERLKTGGGAITVFVLEGPRSV